MKKLKGKLSLNKETVAKLNDDQMKNIKGGNVNQRPSGRLCTGTCPTLESVCYCVPPTVTQTS